MGLKYEDSSSFSKKVFDKYTTKLEHKDEQAHRAMPKISNKLQFTRKEIDKTVFKKMPIIRNPLEIIDFRPQTLRISDDDFELEKSKMLADMASKNPEIDVNSKQVQKEVRKKLAKKHGVKEIKTDSDFKNEKSALIKKADRQTENMRGRMRIAGSIKQGAVNVVTDQGAAREKDLGTETLIKANQYTKKFRRELLQELYTPNSAKRTRKLSRLEKKQSKLESKKNDAIMKEFFNNVHQNEAAVMEGLYETKGMHRQALHTKFRVRTDYNGNLKKVAEIKKFTEENKDVIMHEMQKKRNRKKFEKASRGNNSSKLVLSDRKALFKQTSFFTRAKQGLIEYLKKLIKKLWKWLLALLGFLFLVSIVTLFSVLFSFLFTFFTQNNESTSWTDITDITNNFTKKETDFVPDILASKDPITEDVTIDDYEWYVIEGDTETQVDSEVAVLDWWNELGQADQNKLMAFICTLQTDATLEKVEYIIDDIISRMYSLSITVEERESGEDSCGCGCQSSPPTECSCSGCAGSGSVETKYVQVTKFTIKDIDSIIDELYDEYCTPEEKEQLQSYYQLYQTNRGGNTSLDNFTWYKWYTGDTSPSSYSGWRFIDRGDGNGYTVEQHKGLDIPARTGTSVYMPFDGTIEESDYDDSRGNYLILLNETGNTRVTYMHLNTRFVTAGTEKQRAYTVGDIGSTGDSTGPHLHVNVEIKDESGNWVYVNPLFVFSEEKVYKNLYGEMADEDDE